MIKMSKESQLTLPVIKRLIDNHKKDILPRL
jgi:hypothetical protein